MNFFSKICSSCGVEKSLNDFSLMTQDGETIHGDICATCRAAGNDKKKSGSGSHGAGLKIDAKAKIKHDTDFIVAKELKEANEEFETKHKHENLLHILKRESENIKAAFITFVLSIMDNEKESAPPAEPSNDKNDPIHKIKDAQKKELNHRGALVANQAKQGALEEDLQKAQVDLTTVYIDPNVTGQLKYFTAIFLQFKALMLAGAFIGTVERQYAKIHGGETATMENLNDKTNTTKPDHAPNLTVKPAVAEALVEKATPTMFSEPNKSEEKPKKKKKLPTLQASIH